jgi:hypothetical protein
MSDQAAERATIIDVAAQLLKAAILLRDLGDAMPPSVYATMPADLRIRLLSPDYQDAFDQLSNDVREEARTLALADPLIQAAKTIHQSRTRRDGEG